MSYLLKNRDLILSIREKNEETGEYEQEIGRAVFLAKTIKYDMKPSGSEFFGIKKADTSQWYSSEVEITISGDSYVSPFVIPTPINSDDTIKNIYNLYKSKFYETNFTLFKYKFFLEIKNMPLGESLYKGIITSFTCDESDEHLGLVKFDITFLGKPEQQDKVEQGVAGYLNDLSLKTRLL